MALHLFQDIYAGWVKPAIDRQVALTIGWSLWHKTWRQTTECIPEFLEFSYLSLPNKASLRRYFHRTFDISKPLPNVNEIALAVALELSYDRSRVLRKLSIIRKIANLFFNGWLMNLSLVPVCRNFIETQKAEFPQTLLKESMEANPFIDSLFEQRELLLRAYFASYGTKHGAETVHIYLPRNNETSIDWDPAATIALHVASLRRMELGFYRDCDYSLESSSGSQWLKVAYEDVKYHRESGRFDTYPNEIASQRVIWAL